VSPRSAAIAATILALPFALIFTSLLLGIEPRVGPLDPLGTVDADQPNVIGSAMVFGAWALSVVAFIINLSQILRDARGARGIRTHPVNLALAIVILFFIGGFVVAFVVDQYPCWIGVPNCD
jgi:heme A synthase